MKEDSLTMPLLSIKPLSMNLSELKTFIIETRRVEGVSWFLVDSSPLKYRKVLYTLYVFDDRRNVVATVGAIEELNKAIPRHKIHAVALTREIAGINRSFILAHGEGEGREGAQYLFERAKENWLARGFDDFINA